MQMPTSVTIVFTETMYSEDPFDILPVTNLDVYNLQVARAIKPVCDLYVKSIATTQNVDDMTAQCTQAALMRAIYHHTITAEDDVGMDAMDVDGPPKANCQHTSRELKLLDSLFPMLQVPVNCGMKLSKLLPDVARCHALCFKAIMQTVNDNRRSEIYFATHTCDVAWQPSSRPSSRAQQAGASQPAPGALVSTNWVNATIAQVGDVAAAAECLNKILSNNRTLLDKYVDDRTIDKFIDLIGNQGPHKRFMAFFQAICSCGGKQIISNQELCLTRLFLEVEQRKRLMLTTRCDEPSGALPPLALPLPFGEKQQWHSLSDAALPAGEAPDHGEFIGKEQWLRGFAPVFVKWECSAAWSCGMDELFYHPSVLQVGPPRAVAVWRPSGMKLRPPRSSPLLSLSL